MVVKPLFFLFNCKHSEIEELHSTSLLFFYCDTRRMAGKVLILLYYGALLQGLGHTFIHTFAIFMLRQS
jgi:hypothetical protein